MYCMRVLGRIAYWILAVALLAVILVSLDYTPGQAILIGLVFCPCALALEILMPKAHRPIDKVYLSLAVLLTVVLLIVTLHQFVWTTITQGYVHAQKDVPPMLINPVFLALILTVLSIGDYFWARWLSRKYPLSERDITFFSDRKSVTLKVADIAYIESNDTEVKVITLTGDTYRNKTGISQWENLLGEGFLRIHRSYLVNRTHARQSTPDTVSVGPAELPVSRKYKDAVLQAGLE